jgi:hypothetical protein
MHHAAHQRAEVAEPARPFAIPLASDGLSFIVRQAQRADASVELVDGSAAVSRLFDMARDRQMLPFVAPGPAEKAA